MPSLARHLPILDWGRRYGRAELGADLLAAVIVTIMLVPQSLAYALLAGLPPEAGLYASILPIVLYAVFGTSRALAVGPVAVVSLMTASAVGQVAEQGTAGYAAAALLLARALGRHPARHGAPAAGLPRQLPVASGDRGLHHRERAPDRGGPGRATSSASPAAARPCPRSCAR